jgi:6-phosphogluconate dehydrogenase (decarboxylating)
MDFRDSRYSFSDACDVVFPAGADYATDDINLHHEANNTGHHSVDLDNDGGHHGACR